MLYDTLYSLVMRLRHKEACDLVGHIDQSILVACGDMLFIVEL